MIIILSFPSLPSIMIILTFNLSLLHLDLIPLPTSPLITPTTPPKSYPPSNDLTPPTLKSNNNNPYAPHPPTIIKSTRISNKKTTYLIDYHCNLMNIEPLYNFIPSTTSFPLSPVLTHDNCNTTYKNLCLSLSSTPEAITFS